MTSVGALRRARALVGSGFSWVGRFAGTSFVALRLRTVQALQSEDRGWRALCALVTAGAFVAGILFYTRGALLYGIDYVGIYSWQDFFVRPRTDYLVPSIVSAFLPEHFYAAFYATLFVETATVVFACQSFARALLRRAISGWELRAAQAAAGALYLLSPAGVNYRFVSLIGLTFLSSAALFFVLAYLVEAARAFHERTEFPTRSAILLGLAVALSAPDSFPNVVRVVSLEALGFIALVPIYLGARYRKAPGPTAARWNGVRIVGITFPIAAALLFYPFYRFFSNSQGLGLANVAVVASTYTARFASGSYNTLDLTLRLLGRGSFPKTPYYGLYFTNPWVVLGTWLWPLLALLGPIVIAGLWKFRDRSMVVGLALLSLVGTFWEAGTNPPFGPAYQVGANLLPFGPVFFQTYAISNILLSKFFPVLMAFTLVVVSRAVANTVLGAPAPNAPPRQGRWRPIRRTNWIAGSGPFKNRWERPAFAAQAGVIIAVGLFASLAALPVYTGDIEGTWVSMDQKGYYIPHEYSSARDVLQAHHGNAVLFPKVGTYIRTGWGYNGASGFYINYDYPSQVMVPGFFGPYGGFIPEIVQAYTTVTNPLAPGPGGHAIHFPFGTREFSPPLGGIRYDFVGTAPVNLTGDSWLSISVGIGNESQFERFATNGSLWIGLTSGKSPNASTAWYITGDASNANLTSINATNLNLSVLFSAPSKGAFDPGNLTTVSLWVRDNSSLFPPLIGSPRLFAINSSVIVPTWSKQLSTYAIGYILVDQSLTNGALQSYPLVNTIIDTLLSTKDIVAIYSGPILQLYEIIGLPSTFGTPVAVG